MALSPADAVDIDNRRSLYEVQKSRLGDRTNIVHRMIFISSLKNKTEGRPTVLMKLQEEILNLRDKDDEGISGLLLMYRIHFIIILECSEKYLASVIKYFNCNSESSLINQVRLLVISHDIPQRLLKQMHFCLLDIQAQNLDSFEPSESSEKLVVDLIHQISKLSCHLTKQSKTDLQKIVDNLHTNHPELLPQQAVIHYLLKINDENLSLTQLFAMYNKPFDIVLHSDLVWPLPSRPYPNNYMK